MHRFWLFVISSLVVSFLGAVFPANAFAYWAGGNASKDPSICSEPQLSQPIKCDSDVGTDGYFWYSWSAWEGDPKDIPAEDLAKGVYNIEYSDDQCRSIYDGKTVGVAVPSNALDSPTTVVTVAGCKLYQTPGVTFCTNFDNGTQNCYTEWKAESTGETSKFDAGVSSTTSSPFQLTDNPSSCSKGSYSSGGKSYCYIGGSTDLNIISVPDDEPDNGGSGSDSGDTSGGSDNTGGHTGTDGGGTGGSSGGGSSGSGGGGGSSGGGSSGGGSTGGGTSTGGGDTSNGGGDTSTDDDTTPTDDTDTPTQGDTGSNDGGSNDSGSNDSGDGEESEEPGDGLDAVLDAIGGVRKAINDGFSNLVDTFTNQDGAPSAADVESEFDGQGLTDDLMSQLDTQNEDVQGEITQRYRDLFEDDSSLLGQGLSYVKGVATAWLPEIPGGGGCVPLTFSFQGHTVTIECRVFDLIKAALSWLLFFFTCYQITMIALSYRSASEG
ncbi:hypothetical protein [Salinicola endophyticus]|uniref:Uncharacterized protein n=1 Tax=Salinicola endophyticus TaxID=1949083 RepID=A0AB74U2E0_9GAMM